MCPESPRRCTEIACRRVGNTEIPYTCRGGWLRGYRRSRLPSQCCCSRRGRGLLCVIKQLGHSALQSRAQSVLRQRLSAHFFNSEWNQQEEAIPSLGWLESLGLMQCSRAIWQHVSSSGQVADESAKIGQIDDSYRVHIRLNRTRKNITTTSKIAD